MAGYPVRGNPIFGLAVGQGSSEPSKAKDEMPYTVLGYGNGPGGEELYINGSRRNLTGVNTEDKNHRQQAAVWLRSETHGGDDVGTMSNKKWFDKRNRRNKITNKTFISLIMGPAGNHGATSSSFLEP